MKEINNTIDKIEEHLDECILVKTVGQLTYIYS